MECPECGLDVLVVDGSIGQHLRPTDLRVCSAKIQSETPDEPVQKPAAKKSAKVAKHG